MKFPELQDRTWFPIECPGHILEKNIFVGLAQEKSEGNHSLSSTSEKVIVSNPLLAIMILESYGTRPHSHLLKHTFRNPLINVRLNFEEKKTTFGKEEYKLCISHFLATH